MQNISPAAAVSDSTSRVPEGYVRTLFERFKGAYFERMLVMAFARDFDLAQIIFNDQLPKGQRNFSESDVRDFIGRFNKQEMHVHFLVAKNAIISRALLAPTLRNYELALRGLLNEFSRSLGENHQSGSANAVPEGIVQEGGGAPEQASLQHRSQPPQHRGQPPHEPLDPFPSLAYLVVSPLWSVIFPLPVLLGWLGGIRPWPLLGIALFTSTAFAVAHRQRGWQAWIMLGGLGNLLNLIIVLPLALWDWWAIGLPFLPSGIGLPQWVNASLWGVICAIGCHTLANVLRLVAHKRSWG